MFQIIVGNQTQTAGLNESGGFSWSGSLMVGAIVLVFVVLFGIASLLKKLQRPTTRGLTPQKIKETWAEIEKTSEHGLMGAKLAVIEADKLLDTVLRSMGQPGETLGERLKTAEYRYPNIRNVWPAHKLRNQLVHDSTFEISINQAKRALQDFKSALKTLHVL